MKYVIISKKEEDILSKEWPGVENPGILEVPKNKNVQDLPLKHFKNLAEKKGLEAITKALMNLYRWNKNRDPELSEWADKTQEKLSNWVKKQRKEDFDFAK